jgi:MFS family permease
MRQINNRNIEICTVLSFILIPLSGLATDVYMPSMPDMAKAFDTDASGIQKTLILFLISYGVAQFFAGAVLDSFGRYRTGLWALAIFTATNFIIVTTSHLEIIYAMRIIQGIATAFIVVGKRAFFVDVYEGEKQKHYTGLLTIVWATAPIIALFVGGFLQKKYGWASNFELLGIYSFIMLVSELIFGGESLQQKKPFKIKGIANVYKKLLSDFQFSAGLFVLGISNSIVIVFSMAVPFIVEHRYHMSPVVTGYSGLISGVAILVGGILGKMSKKNIIVISSKAIVVQIILIAIMLATSFNDSYPLMMIFVFMIHAIVGFIFNLFFTFCLTRFPENAGVASGLTSGGNYMVTSAFSTSLLAFIYVNDQLYLATCYFILSAIVCALLFALRYKVYTKKLLLLMHK